LEHEGIGDKVTGTPTGPGGITEARKRDIERRVGNTVSYKEAREIAVREDSAALHKRMDGFDKLEKGVQAAVLDLAYNIGWRKVLKFPKLTKAVANGDVNEILINTLDTASENGKSLLGLAKRRALMFNQAGPDSRITHVEQLNDGTINYLSDTKVLFTFKLPRHPKSTAGKINLKTGAFTQHARQLLSGITPPTKPSGNS
jgi:GH24 family phage-related lysozyme (muramidase)